MPALKHHRSGTLTCSCGARVLIVVEHRQDKSIWFTARCSRCLADTEWVPIEALTGDLGDL